MDLDCKDASGEDPFAENKKMIGTTVESDMEFSTIGVTVKNDGAEVLFERIRDEGCTSKRPSLRYFFGGMM